MGQAKNRKNEINALKETGFKFTVQHVKSYINGMYFSVDETEFLTVAESAATLVEFCSRQHSNYQVSEQYLQDAIKRGNKNIIIMTSFRSTDDEGDEVLTSEFKNSVFSLSDTLLSTPTMIAQFVKSRIECTEGTLNTGITGNGYQNVTI